MILNRPLRIFILTQTRPTRLARMAGAGRQGPKKIEETVATLRLWVRKFRLDYFTVQLQLACHVGEPKKG